MSDFDRNKSSRIDQIDLVITGFDVNVFLDFGVFLGHNACRDHRCVRIIHVGRRRVTNDDVMWPNQRSHLGRAVRQRVMTGIVGQSCGAASSLDGCEHYIHVWSWFSVDGHCTGDLSDWRTR